MGIRANQLIEGSADFALLTEADLPEVWLQDVDEGFQRDAAEQMGLRFDQVCPCVVVEVPDLPWAWKYQQWSQDVSVPGALPIMVTSLSEFRGGHSWGSGDAVVDCFWSLVMSGKPAPFFARIFVRRC